MNGNIEELNHLSCKLMLKALMKLVENCELLDNKKNFIKKEKARVAINRNKYTIIPTGFITCEMTKGTHLFESLYFKHI